jgi:hypothetical protein
MAKIVVKLSILSLLLIISAILGFMLYYDVFQVTYNASYIDKVKRLESLQNTRKAVFIGGSATHFGIQAELFEKETNIPAINMGLNVGVALKIYMDNVLPYLNSGDILFLCPEYEYYSWKFNEISKESIELIYMTDTAIDITPFYKIKAIPTTLMMGWGFIKDIMIKYLENKNYIEVLLRDGLKDHRRTYSDKYGDYKGIKDLPNRSFEIYHSIVYADNRFISELDNYADYFSRNNIELYLLFPPSTHSLSETSNAELEKIYSKILSSKNLKPLFRPQDVVYKDHDFFDSVYHLNYKMAIQHTQYIIDKYKALPKTEVSEASIKN